MEPRKLTKEDIDKVRHIDGFPIAKDEDIIALSNAPYYTACPNPFIEEFVKEYGKPYDEVTDSYHREPFAADVTEGKNEAIYNAHSYHTKVPYKAIMRYILHYTNPGDLVLDGFCGTGMTGVAAQMCGKPQNEFRMQIEQEMPTVEWGERKAILNDLSPAATFISYNYNAPINVIKFEDKARKILAECEEECSWMYETNHHTSNNVNNKQIEMYENSQKGRINYVVWSDVFICPNCSKEIVFWDVAVNKETGKVDESFICDGCNVSLKKKDCQRANKLEFDKVLNNTVSVVKQIPVLINYSYNSKRFEKTPDEDDLRLIEKINSLDIPHWYPSNRMCEGIESRRNDKIGITNAHQFLQKRTLYILSFFRSKCDESELLWLITAVLEGASKLNRERPGGLPSKLTGTLYVSSLIREIDVLSFIGRKIEKYLQIQYAKSGALISTSSTTMLALPNNTCDYIFTDPPFGDNLNYSELSFVWESWLKVITNNLTEAVMNKVHGKGLLEYQHLMTSCFKEYYRVLKPNRWMTVEFHNSKNAVWNAIQEALQRSGFIIADVRTLDKQQGSFKQVNSTNAVKQDLVISAYKPKDAFIREFTNNAGSIETTWSFIRQHLENIPIVVIKNEKIETVAERQAFLLFDRMVAYHIILGIAVPLDATDFYKGLDERFLKRDGMYFLPDQVNEYDTARITNDVEPIQFELFVTNEKSAIAWLYQQLDSPQTYAELQPKFMQEIKAWDKFEERPELNSLLEENFLQNDDGKWYVPDVTKAADVIKLREKKLLKEFEGYIASKGKLKLFRAEAVRVGFAKLWTDKNYKLIVETADRLPESVIQEDDKLLMYYDISLGRI